MEEDIGARIIDLQDDDDYVNIMVFADPGVGKTVFAGSDDRVLFIAPEDQGTLSAKRYGSKAQKFPVKHWDDMEEVCVYFERMVRNGETIPYDWFSIDSLTELQDLGMRGILDFQNAKNPERDLDIPALADWQKYYEMVKRMIKRFNNLPVNVCYTALARVAEEGGQEILIPDIQGKKDQYSKKVASWMTSFGYMEYKKVKDKESSESEGRTVYKDVRTIYWKPTRLQPRDILTTGKDRTFALEPKTVNLSLKDIRERIEHTAGGYASNVSTEAAKPKRRKTSAPAEEEQLNNDDSVELEEDKELEDIDA